jgi:hypothetical protein
MWKVRLWWIIQLNDAELGQDSALAEHSILVNFPAEESVTRSQVSSLPVQVCSQHNLFATGYNFLQPSQVCENLP